MRAKRDDFVFDDDAFLIKLTAAHCRAARGWLGWTQADLARRSGVGLSAIKDYEKGNRKTHKGVQILLQSTFAKAGVWCSDAGLWHEDEFEKGDQAPEEFL